MKKENRNRKSRKSGSFFSHGDEAFLSVEKKKARELRNSAWWRRKIATGECYYCRRIFPPDELTMDHRIPLARGGRSEKINLVPACKECNNKKKHLLPHEWDEYMNSIREA